MEHINISLPNFKELKDQLILNWHTLENAGYNRPNNPYWIKIYDLLNVKTHLTELESAKEYLKQFELTTFQIVVYLPYARTGFHIDGGINRYVLPIVSSKNAINFELDGVFLHNPKMESIIQKYNECIGYNSEPSDYKFKDFDWFDMAKYKNFMFTIDENKCIKIGDNWHAHMNNHYQHRIVIVFDSKENIVVND
jgi:hypothetical protein